MRILVALDQGTTSSRAIVFDEAGHTLASHAIEFKQHYPQPGWVEHDPDDILGTQVEALQRAVKMSKVDVRDIAAIGITNQRETTLLWEKDTGRCVHNAIVWQCRRSAPYVEKLVREGHGETIRKKTGLVPDAYFSGTKLAWLLDTLNLHERAEKGELCFGTVDSFLAWHLVEGRPHVTDATNAGRTMLFNLHTQAWDDELLGMLNIPRAVLPQVVDTAQVIGNLRPEILGRPIPVAAMAGDQHASLFGQACFEPGMVKNTYGTGCFMLMNIGDEIKYSKNGLVTTIAWGLEEGKVSYALEGSIFVAGAAIQWLRDELKIVDTSPDSEYYAAKVADTNGVYVVPAFVGLGAPYWDQYARGTIVGLTRGANKSHLIRATLESLAYQTYDVLKAMEEDSGISLAALKVDCGACKNNFLMQFQSDVIQAPVRRPMCVETTAMGAAYLAGLAVGYWKTKDDVLSNWAIDNEFKPEMCPEKADKLISGWKKAVKCSFGWAKD